MIPALRERLRRFAEWAGRGFGWRDRRLVADYLSSAAPPLKLHLGCGLHPLPGWLNSDLLPPSGAVLHLDVERPFPFDDDRFDFVFSEHLIEHLRHSAGVGMLAECRRVLRPGGILRLATPDLRFLFALAGPQPSALEVAYVQWASGLFYPDAGAPSPVFVINNFFRNWGHRFLYDEAILRRALERAGFVDIRAVSLGESAHPELRGLENEGRLPPGFLRLETMVMEAAKPPRPPLAAAPAR